MDFNPEILRRFFTGNYSRKDFRDVKSIFSANNLFLENHLRKHWNEFNGKDPSEIETDHLLHQIHHKIRLEENNDKKMKFMNAFQRIAAILIIPLLLSFLTVLYVKMDNDDNTYDNPDTFAEIHCPMGVRTSFELPDGTTGFINSGSTLKYPVSFSRGRNVVLTGEAYFDVFHDADNPFTVKTKGMQIKVLGTKFNVIAYPDEHEEKVVLSSGQVEISSVGGVKLDVLEPNQKLVLDIDKNTYETSDAEAFQYIGWTEGKLIFRNEDLSQVAERIGRWYNADVEFENEEAFTYNLRATFVDETLDEVLKLIALAAPITWEEVPRDFNQNNNSYQKRKIIIKLDDKRMNSFK